MQSLSEPSQPSAGFGVSSETYNTEHGMSQSHPRREFSGRTEKYAPQVDYRQEPTPLESCSLADYIRSPSIPVPAPASSIKFEEPALQAQMESEFPNLDSALIAAILADYSDSTEAKNVLSALS